MNPLVIVVPVVVVLAGVVVLAALRRRDVGAATGALSREDAASGSVGVCGVGGGWVGGGVGA